MKKRVLVFLRDCCDRFLLGRTGANRFDLSGETRWRSRDGARLLSWSRQGVVVAGGDL